MSETKEKSSSRILVRVVVALLIAVVALIATRVYALHRTQNQGMITGFFESQPTLVASRLTGRAARFVVKEGEKVRAGQLLAVLETNPDAADAASVAAQAREARARLLEIERGARREDIQKAEGALAEQEANLQKLLNGNQPEDIAVGRAQTEQSRAQIANAQAGVAAARDNKLVAGTITTAAQSALQQSRDNVEAVAADLASARATYARTLRSATAAQAQVRNAVAERQQRQAGVESAQAQVSATAAAVEMARANLVAAQAETERADKDAQRANELYDGGALSAQSRDKSRKDAKSARAQEEAARRAVEQALANRLKAQADTRNAQAQLAGAAAQIAQAQAQFEAARESVNEARAGIDQSRARLKQAQSAVLEERANVDRRVREQLATGNSIRQASATLESNRAALSSTQASLQKLESGSRAEDIAAQRARVVQARSALEVLRRGSRPEEIARLRAAYQSAEELSRKAKLTLREGKVRAPRDGIVDRIFVAPGDLVTTGTALIRISDPNDLWIRVYIPESNLSRVRVGDAAELQINGISEPVAAVVESVATTGEFTPANLQTSEERAKQVFGVRLRLKRVDDRVKPGMFAVTKRIGDWP